MDTPKRISAITAMTRKLLGSIWNAFSRYEMESVKTVKLVMIPSVMPNGLLLPAPTDTERMIGNNGQMHGARIVTNPARNEKKSNTGITPSLLMSH